MWLLWLFGVLKVLLQGCCKGFHLQGSKLLQLSRPWRVKVCGSRPSVEGLAGRVSILRDFRV